MTSTGHDSHPHDPQEQSDPDVTRALSGLVDGVHVTGELRDRVAHALRQRAMSHPRWKTRPLLAVAAAVAVLAGGAVALTANRDGSRHEIVAAEDPDTTSRPPSTTSTAPDPDAPPATVAGVVITRPSTTTTAGVAAPVTEPAVAPAAPPPTTLLVCHNSTDPACGPFRWEPAPDVTPSVVRILLPDEPVRAGVPQDIVVELADAGHAPSFNCATLGIDPPPSSEGWVGGFGGCMVEREDCGARFGPWSPPPRNGRTISASSTVTFETPGTYELKVHTAANRGCWDPYGTDATATSTLEVIDQ